MRKFKLFIFANFALTLLLLTIILVWKLVIQGKTPGFVVIGIAVILVVNAVFCILSIAGINRGHQQLIAKLWLLEFSVVCFYIVLDVGGGFLFVQPMPYRNSPDEHVHHKMLPRTSYRDHDRYGEYDVVITTNNMGFRGRDIKEKEPGTYRIVMLGDSFTAGAGMRDDQTFPYLIEQYLNETQGSKYEVINLGVSSYSPILEYIQLKEYIGMLKPNMIVLNFDMSDLLNEYVYRKIASYDKAGNIIAVNGFPEYNRQREDIREISLNWIYRHLFITGHVVENLIKHFGANEAEDINKMTVRTAVESPNGTLLIHTLDMPQLKEAAKMYSMVENSIEKVKELCDRFGCNFILSVYPWGHQLSSQEWVPGRYGFIPSGVGISDRTVLELEKFSKARRITFFNAFPDFRQYKGGLHLYFSHDMHWTPMGQELMAKSLAKFLEEYLNKDK